MQQQQGFPVKEKVLEQSEPHTPLEQEFFPPLKGKRSGIFVLHFDWLVVLQNLRSNPSLPVCEASATSTELHSSGH